MTPHRLAPWYDAWYFSRLNVCSAAAALTACSSAVLVGRVAIGAVLVVTLGTYVVYVLDDLLDRQSDEARFPVLGDLRRTRALSAAVTLPVAGLTLAHLVVTRGVQAPWHLLLQASVSLGFCAATCKWPSLERGRHWSIARALFVSLVWATVCALTPLWWVGHPYSFRAARAVLFLWQLMFVIVLLWEEGETLSGASTPHRRLADDPVAQRRLKAICICSGVLACIGVWLGHFPAANLTVAAASALNLAAVGWWTRSRLDGRHRNDLLVLANNTCCAVVIAVHVSA